jgi:AcrR family transcriptional regulator
MNEIATAAIELIAERGFDEVTIDDIARHAGISARTFFRYFPSKDDIVTREQERVQQRLVRALRERPDSEGAVEALRNAYVESSAVTDRGRHRALTYGRVQLQNPSLNARLIGAQALGAPDLVQLVAARMGVDPARDPRPETIAAAMNAVATAMFRRWVADGGAGTPSDSIADALDALIEGLSTLEGRPTTRRPRGDPDPRP